MPSWDLFERQSLNYRDSVLPPGVVARVAVEQAATFGWERYIGTQGAILGMTSFGASAPLKALQKDFRFDVDHVVDIVQQVLARKVAICDAMIPRHNMAPLKK
jgi:transketolase